MKETIVLVAALSIGIAYAEFNCQTKGRFLNSHSNCTQFFDCQLSSNNTFQMTRMSCPFEELFSIEEQRCVLASNLMCRLMTDGTTTSMPILIDTATTPSPKESSSGVKNTADDYFQCLAVGRYPSSSPGCRKYLDCQLQSRNILLKIEICPESTIFSPKKSNCVPETDFICPTVDTSRGESVYNIRSQSLQVMLLQQIHQLQNQRIKYRLIVLSAEDLLSRNRVVSITISARLTIWEIWCNKFTCASRVFFRKSRTAAF